MRHFFHTVIFWVGPLWVDGYNTMLLLLALGAAFGVLVGTQLRVSRRLQISGLAALLTLCMGLEIGHSFGF